MANQEFVFFRTGSGKSVHGEHYFRKSSVVHFGITERNHNMSTRFFRLKVDYTTSESSSDTFTMDMADDKAFREFAAQMESTGMDAHMDTPEEPRTEPSFVTRDCLEITDGAEEFFKWLHGKYCNSEKIACWSFKAVPCTYDEDFIVCHKTTTLTSPADVHISFRGRLTYASVCGIVVKDHYTPDNVEFNLILHEFVNNIVRPYAYNHKIAYSYSGTPNEQPLKSNGTLENTNTDTLDSLDITGEAEGLYAFLLTKAAFPDIGGQWSVSREDDKFTCTRYDADATKYFTVTLAFMSNGSYAKVTAIEAPGTYIDADSHNRFLRRFVSEIVKPYAETQKLIYRYSGKC